MPQLVKATAEVSAGKIPVLAGTGFGGGLSVELTKSAQEHGADGILMFPPYYPNADFEGLLDYYKGVGKATSLGLLIYSRDWVNLNPAQVARAAEELPNLIAFKEGQADTRVYQRIMARVGDRLHWIGGQRATTACRPTTRSACALTPRASRRSRRRLSLQLHERASMLDMSSLHRLMTNYVLPLYGMRSRRKGYEVTVMKEAMNILGKVAAAWCARPLPSLRPRRAGRDREVDAGLRAGSVDTRRELA